MRRLRCFQAVLPWLVATSLTACGSPAPGTAPAAPEPDPAGAASDPTPPADRQGRLWGDPMADQTPVSPISQPETPVDAGESAAEPDSAPAPAAAPPTANPLIPGQSGGRIAFASTRQDGGGQGFDIYIFDRATGTIVAPVGVNTEADEVQPFMTHDGRWLIYATNAPGSYDIQLFDVEAQTIDPLQTLNSPARDDRQPTISLDGRHIAYSSLETGARQLRLHDVVTGQNVVPEVTAGLTGDVFDPNISADGRRVAFTSRGETGERNIVVYDLAAEALHPIPFVNSAADEFDPWLSADGRRLLYASSRAGKSNIYMTDLQTGLTDEMALANGPFEDRNPRYLSPDTNEVIFQSDRLGPQRLMAFTMPVGRVDPLPITHDIGEDDLIEDEFRPGSGALSGGLGNFGRIGGGIGGGLSRRGLF